MADPAPSLGAGSAGDVLTAGEDHELVKAALAWANAESGGAAMEAWPKVQATVRDIAAARLARAVAADRERVWGEGWNARARGEFWQTNPYREEQP